MSVLVDKKFFYAILTAVNFGDVMKLPGKLIFIKEAILTDIRNGVLKADEKIPSRSACMERFHCARATIDRAIAECNEKGIKGKETTPFLLARVAELTGGDSLASNIRLVFNNARVAAQTAVAYCNN